MSDMRIQRRSFLATGAGAVAATAAVPQASFGAQQGRPNILMLIADDVSQYDLGCYGHPTICTPNLDTIAHSGVRFMKAFVTTSSCSPSRSSVFTGRYPHATGAEDLHRPLPAEQKIIPELLAPAGYFTGNSGKFHLGKASANKLDRIYNKVEDWRRFFDDRPKNQPFFLAVGFHDAHRPYQEGTIQNPHKPEDAIVPPYLADDPVIRKDLAMYYDEIARLDMEAGLLMDRLKEDGVFENTLVLFWGDNGMPFPRAKTTIYDSGIGTPLIAHQPGHIPAGSVDYGLASTVDIAPTFLEIAGVPIPDTMQGRSMKERFLKPNSSARTEIFAERNWHDFDDHSRAVRTERYKYIRNAYPEKPLSSAADVLRSPSGRRMKELRDAGQLTREQLLPYRDHRAPEELYDLYYDPHEFHNLANEPAYQSVLGRLRKLLDNWLRETEDVSVERRLPDEFNRNTGERIRERTH